MMVSNSLNQVSGERWSMIHGDCCDAVYALPEDSIHYSIYSLPFLDLFVYSESDRDMGNCSSPDEFYIQYEYMLKGLYRAMMPGRLVSVHCMNLPATKGREGYIGIKDFRGDIIRSMQKEGFVFHSEVCIWKNPVVAMQRTKALGLLHKTIKKDSTRSRMGIPDYVLTFGKPGKNPEPVSGELGYWVGDDSFSSTGNYSIDVWQRYASPVWMDINQSDTLNGKYARDDKDERHLCALQIDVIRRCLQLWSNPGDTVLSPFAGIGSEGWVSVNDGRNFIGMELKESYFNAACDFLRKAEQESNQPSLFDKASK